MGGPGHLHGVDMSCSGGPATVYFAEDGLQKTHAGQLGPDFLTNNPGNIHKVTNCIVMEIFMP